MRIVVASTLAVLAAAAAFSPARGQPREGLTDCGARPPVRYAAVFDASSSVRGDPALRAETEASYRKLLGLLSGVLCTGDTLAVYTFVADSITRMDPLVEITRSTRNPTLLSATARRVIETRSSHTDLHLVSRRVFHDVIVRTTPRAVFVVTDGSFYPFQPTADDRTFHGLENSLNELAAFVTDTLRPDSSGLFVIGVNAANSYAIDRQLGAVLPAASDERRWREVDLLEDHGEKLLAGVFGKQYIELSDLSLWDILIGLPQSVWTRRLGYLTDRDLTWNEVSTLSVQHLVYVPGGPGGSTTCTSPSGNSAPPMVQEVRYAVSGEVLCSLNNPTPAQLAAIREQPRFYALLQGVSLWPDGIARVSGLNDLLLRDSAHACSRASLRSYFGSGGRWPPAASAVGELRIARAGTVVWREPIPLIPLGSTGCVVPRFESGGWPSSPGEYFVKVVHKKTSVFRVAVEPARMQVVEAFIRPGGLPFPSDKIGLVRVCVRINGALSRHERMWMRLEEKLLPVTLERARRRCGGGPNVAAFSGLVGLEHTDRNSAELFVANEGVRPDTPQDGEWLAVKLRRDGKLFQSSFYFWAMFGLGMLAQVLYACIADRRFHADRLRRGATWSGAVLSGIIVAVLVQFAVMMAETDLDSDRVPVLLALSVLAHMAKLLAAALMPEHVEEFLLNN